MKTSRDQAMKDNLAKFINSIYELDYEDNIQGAQQNELKLVHGKQILKDDVPAFRAAVRTWKNEYRSSILKREYTKLLKNKLDYTFTDANVFSPKPLTFSVPNDLDYKKRYFCADFSILDEDEPKASHSQAIAIVHCGSIPEQWE